MKLNIGKLDRLIRIIIGGALFLAFLNGTLIGPMAIVALIVCAIMMLTAILGTCPLYTKMGWNTLDKKKID